MSNFWHQVRHLKRGKCFSTLVKALTLDAFQLSKKEIHDICKKHFDIVNCKSSGLIVIWPELSYHYWQSAGTG